MYYSDLQSGMYESSIWAVCMNRPYERYVWIVYMSGIYKSSIWAVCMNRPYERYVWIVHMGGMYESSIWAVCMNRLYERYVWIVHMLSVVGITCIYINCNAFGRQHHKPLIRFPSKSLFPAVFYVNLKWFVFLWRWIEYSDCEL